MNLSKRSIHHHLVGLTILSVVPVLIFCVLLISNVVDQRSRNLEDNYRGTAQAVKVAFDQQIVSVISSLKILAEVEDFRPDTIQYLHKRLRRFVQHQKVFESIAFVDTTGTQIFNTAIPYGRKLPRLHKETYFRQMIEGAETVVSQMDPETRLIAVAAPVKTNGMIVYSLVATLNPDALPKLLRSQRLPPDWHLKIADDAGTLLAETGEVPHDSAHPKTLTLRSKITGWSFTLLIPETHEATFWKTMPVMAFGGLSLFVLSLLLALLLGRSISQPLRALSAAAKNLGRGLPIDAIDSSVQEASDVSEALLLAAQERNQSEKIMKLLYEKEQEAVKIRDTFLSVASHELKTPITTLKLQLQMLDRKVKKEGTTTHQEMERPISRIEDQVTRLVSLIDDLLDVSRINAGKMEFHPESFDLVPFVQELASQSDGMALEARSSISIIGEASIVGVWDRHRLEQIMLNLITNAIKYGDGQPIVINLRTETSFAVVEVSDNGIGISEENQVRIFERFERAVDGSNISGLGLGLWIVKKIVDGLGGNIAVRSSLGKGSTFTLRLPLSPHTRGGDTDPLKIDFTDAC